MAGSGRWIGLEALKALISGLVALALTAVVGAFAPSVKTHLLGQVSMPAYVLYGIGFLALLAAVFTIRIWRRIREPAIDASPEPFSPTRENILAHDARLGVVAYLAVQDDHSTLEQIQAEVLKGPHNPGVWTAPQVEAAIDDLKRNALLEYRLRDYVPHYFLNQQGLKLAHNNGV